MYRIDGKYSEIEGGMQAQARRGSAPGGILSSSSVAAQSPKVGNRVSASGILARKNAFAQAPQFTPRGDVLDAEGGLTGPVVLAGQRL